MMLVRAYLAPSPIEGLGVFSRDPIRAGETIWRFDPRLDQLIPREIYEASEGPTRDFLDRYAYEIPTHPGHVALDADESRYMNHSDTPNCDFGTPGIGIALSDIEPGTELTCDYGRFMSGDLYFLPPRHHVEPETGSDQD